MYELKEQYLTGMETIDDQHRKIFQLADQVYELLKDENMLYKDGELLKIVQELQDYTKYHFSEEEIYMEKIGYSRLEEQKIQHEKFIEELDKLNQAVQQISLRNQDQVIFKLLDYLTYWLKVHIEKFDMLIKKEI